MSTGRSQQDVDKRSDKNIHSVHDIYFKDLKMSIIFIGNSNTILEMFKEVTEQFTVMFRRKVFLIVYSGRHGQDGVHLNQEQY